MVAVTSLLCSLARSSATSSASAVESSGSLRRWRRRTGAGPCCRSVTASVRGCARPAARGRAGPPGGPVEAGAVPRVEVDDDPVGALYLARLGDRPLVHVQLEAARLASQVKVARSSTTGKTRTSPLREGARDPVVGTSAVRTHDGVPPGMFFEEALLLHAVGPAHPGRAAVRQQRQHRRRHLGVVVEDLALGGARARVDHHVEVAELEGAAIDLDAHLDRRLRAHVSRSSGRGRCGRRGRTAAAGAGSWRWRGCPRR